MAKDGPNWEALLKGSLSHSDGTGSTRTLSEEERKWFMEAMQAQTIDVSKSWRLKLPQQVLKNCWMSYKSMWSLLTWPMISTQSVVWFLSLVA
ncbi:hypothetical protein SLE2022_075360 [Rubroshorea leprosula]